MFKRNMIISILISDRPMLKLSDQIIMWSKPFLQIDININYQINKQE